MEFFKIKLSGPGKYFKTFGNGILKEVENHSCVTFLSKETCVYNAEINPLFDDEVSYQRTKYNINSFKFNSGCNTFTQEYYVARLQNVYVEPTYGLVIKGFRAVIKESVFYDWYKISKKKYLAARIIFFWKIKYLPSAIFFDGAVGLNYFHFYNDVITKLDVVKQRFGSTEIPLLISSKVFNSSLFQFYYQFEFIRKNNWFILSGDRFVKVCHLYIIKARQFDFRPLNEIAQKTLGGLKKPLSTSRVDRKIFINRKEEAGRFISNFQQLEPMLTQFGIKTVYMEDMAFEDQFHLVRNAELIIGVHGAGLTNLIFSDPQKVEVIEILPRNFCPTHYYWLCNSFSIKYKAFYGTDLTANRGFQIDVERFGEVVSRYAYLLLFLLSLSV